jgi:hypothetical protein
MRDLAAEWEAEKFGMGSNLPQFLGGAAMFETQPFGGQAKQIEGISFDASSLNKRFKFKKMNMNKFFR